MAKLITADDLTRWAGSSDGKPGYLLLQAGTVLTPGAWDAARMLGVQVLQSGPATRAVLARIAEEVTGGPVGAEDLAKLIAVILAKTKE